MASPIKKTKSKPSKGKTRVTGKQPKREKGSILLAAPAFVMRPRLLFIASTVALLIFGLVMMYSASFTTAISNDQPADFYLTHQLLFLAIGLIFVLVLASAPYQIYGNKVIVLGAWVLTLLLLLAIQLGMGSYALGAERSISLGFISIQPSEFAKISLILLEAACVAWARSGTMSKGRAFGIGIGAFAITEFLILLQPDLGSAIILFMGILTVAWLAGMSFKQLGIVLIFVAIVVIAECIREPYHLERVMTLFNPDADAADGGYQSRQAAYAFASGGLTGVGFGFSRQKYFYLPYAHTDFIYAIVGEELGFVGALAVLILFAIFVIAGLQISRRAPDHFAAMIAGGMTTIIGFQAGVNMACVAGIAPVTGKALPFFSYGGSSLLSTLIMVGIILSVSMRSHVASRSERRRDDLIVMEGGRGKPDLLVKPVDPNEPPVGAQLMDKVVSLAAFRKNDDQSGGSHNPRTPHKAPERSQRPPSASTRSRQKTSTSERQRPRNSQASSSRSNGSRSTDDKRRMSTDGEKPQRTSTSTGRLNYHDVNRKSTGKRPGSGPRP